ncbi:GTPase [Thalassoroseus pseudoceratinae]|uniref:GTPase n=1 Tax=Thalassoroseus pseudoceratinae TaxID=2713176 RepID=UPI00142266F5|nr:GTPase [Thalassoroseus pseudoceratinae]
MPANLTPQYHKAEDAYRRAQSAEERVACLQEMIKLIPKHKGTDHLQADLKTRLKEAKQDVETEKKAPKTGRTFRFPRQGAGQVLVLGAPNAGKSRVLAELTNAEPEVANYPYTTHEPMPGMMPWQDATVQLIDTPPTTADHLEPYVLNLVRTADLVVLCLDGSSDDAPDETAELLEQFRSRSTMLGRENGFVDDDFSLVQVKTLVVVTRAGSDGLEERLEYFREMVPTPFEIQRVEFDREDSREELRDRVFQMLGVIRVYTKAPGKPAEYKDPFTIPVGGTVEDLAVKVHRDLAESLKFAKVWGESAHDGQSVGRDHQLADRDLVELHA